MRTMARKAVREEGSNVSWLGRTGNARCWPAPLCPLPTGRIAVVSSPLIARNAHPPSDHISWVCLPGWQPCQFHREA